MKTKTITLYQFDELSDEAKENAIEKLRDINVNYPDWDDYLIDNWQEALEKIGFQNAKIEYSGFWSQGDGASFTADINSEKIFSSMVYCRAQKDYPSARIIELAEKIYINDGFKMYLSRGRSNYSHERAVSINIDVENPYRDNRFWAKIIERFENALDDFRIDLCHAIYKTLETNYNYLTSDEAIAEAIRANEYDFLENGEMA